MLISLLWLLLFWINTESKPNIIFILVDDLGYDDLGFQGGYQISTPNINKLRSESQFFEWYYGQCNCSPSRGALMTGRYPIHNTITTIIQPSAAYGLPLNFQLIPQILHKYGNYTTHAIGYNVYCIHHKKIK